MKVSYLYGKVADMGLFDKEKLKFIEKIITMILEGNSL